MKKYLISTFALGMILSTTLSVNADNKVKDIEGHWANKQISKFIENSYANGYEDNTFRPDNQITRAEFVKLVNKYFGFNEKGVSDLKDINPKNWYYNDVCIAIKAGYINGYEDNTFRPDKQITREEAAKIIVSIKNQQDNTCDKLDDFPDKHLVSNWAKPYVEGAIENGYLKGDELKNLRPVSRITRAESVTLLSRIEDKNNDLDDNEYPNDELYPINPENNEYPNDELYPVNPDEVPPPPFAKDKNYNGKPVIFMRDVEFHVPKYSKWNNYDPNEILQADAFDKDGKPLKVEFAGYVDTNIVGKFIVTAMARDSEGRYSESEVVVFVEDYSRYNDNLPSIDCSSRDIFLRLGDAFDYKMLESKAKDSFENDISSSIKYSGKVDVNRPGQYPIVITATDSYGNSNYEVVIVYVQ